MTINYRKILLIAGFFVIVIGLAFAIYSLFFKAPAPIVVINADNNATHQSVIRVMDAARQAGYGQVAFAVEQATR